MKIMDYPPMTTPTGPDALVIHDNESGTTKYVTVTNLFSTMYPIGSIYINATNSSNPGSLLGFGTWVAFGSGRVPVGFDASQSEFNATEKTGGAKTVSLTGDQNGTHSHGVYDPGHNHGFSRDVAYTDNSSRRTGPGNGEQAYGFGGLATNHSGTGIGIYNSGSGAPHQNLQPYITVYMWKRTA